MEYAIETEGLTKTYKGRVAALRGVSLKVPMGCAFGLLGPNGAGKSTLVKSLLSIVRPSGGTGMLLGRDIRLTESRRGVGYLPEGLSFPIYLTGREACTYFGRLGGLSGATLKQEVDDKLRVVGMTDWADRRIQKYSKGMKQRIGLAQAMLGEPRLILLDEPTDGVDPAGRHDIRQVIRDIARRGFTVFLNSHMLSEVEQVCDQVAIMHHGNVLRQGTIAEITRAVNANTRQSVLFKVGSLNSEAMADIARIGEVTQFDDGFSLVIDDPAATTRAIDCLRARQVEIHAVEPQRASLEDVFIRLIGEQADQGVGGTVS